MFVVVSFLMKIKQGTFRIYIVLSIIWFCFFFFGFLDEGYLSFESYKANKLLITSLLPLPLYFVFKWIAKGFE